MAGRNRRATVILGFAVAICTAPLVAASSPRAGAALAAFAAAASPPFADLGLPQNSDYYHLEFLPDGFPGQRRGDQVVPHPILGVYVLRYFVRQFDSSPSEALRSAIARVATAAVARMEPFEDALVFWYEPSDSVARLQQRHYSGLTQAYYASALLSVARITGEARFRDAADRVFRSLLIPADRGGVLYPGVLGPSIAEVPQRPNGFVLNGWQTALVSVHEYAEATGSHEASELFRASAAEMARLLPLYDAPGLRNSRYALSGFVYARLLVDPGVRLSDIRLRIPGQGSFPVQGVLGSRWQNGVFPGDLTTDGVASTGTVRFNLVLSRSSFPEENSLSVTVPAGTRVEFQVRALTYDPLASSARQQGWVSIGEQIAGEGETSFNIPWDAADLVAYPTDFAKKLGGGQTNVYHLIHIQRLRELAAMSGNPAFTEWADRWHGYICEWSSMPIYAGLFVTAGSRSVPVERACATTG